MTQGTVSIFFGCHSPFHSIQVIRAWIKLYGSIPSWREMICIFLHDIGHFGRNYLDDYEQKKTHWELGAKIAYILFGPEGYRFVAGHCTHSGYPKSPLYKADKYSWHIAPRWWLWLNCVFEPKLQMGYSKWGAVDAFKAQVADSVENGHFKSTHSFFLERCKGSCAKGL